MEDFKSLSKGISHFAIKRYPDYFHHFIVAELSVKEKKEVIEYASVSSRIKGPGEIVQKNISKNVISDYIEEQKLYVIQAPNYPKTDEEIEIAKNRAFKRLGENAYYLPCNNCEHFATYVLTGKATSEQIENTNWLEKMAIDTVQTFVVEIGGSVILLTGYMISLFAALVVPDSMSKKNVQKVGSVAYEVTHALYKGVKLTKLYSEQYINANDYGKEMRHTICTTASNTLLITADMLGKPPQDFCTARNTAALSLVLHAVSSAGCGYLLN